jgi:[ribosomal protein S5]-alanine N-acetyltransferase
MKRILEKPSARRRTEFLAAVASSRKLHGKWVSPPHTKSNFEKYLRRYKLSQHVSYWVVTETGELAGVINFSEIVRGSFHSAYLSYYGFVPHDGRGYMTKGLRAAVDKAFRSWKLHRLEANIQPKNGASRNLVQRLGFKLEGFSPRYLKIAGRWRDHERWAITREDWKFK